MLANYPDFGCKHLILVSQNTPAVIAVSSCQFSHINNPYTRRQRGTESSQCAHHTLSAALGGVRRLRRDM